MSARAEPRYRLFCVPYAGGGSGAYRLWPPDLPDWVEVVAVRLPGREASIDQEPLDRIGPVVDLLHDAGWQPRKQGFLARLFSR